MKLRIFLASSKELVQDRRDFELFLSRRNQLSGQAFLDLMIWETHIDAMSKTRLQDGYNKTIGNSDVFIMLFHSKVGRYTREEFETAFCRFVENGRPLVYTYFKSAPVRRRRRPGDQQSVQAFQERLVALGHFCPSYRSIEDLQLQFGRQLDKLMLSGANPAGGRSLSVSLLSQPSWLALQANQLTYTSEEKDAVLLIKPRMPYLEQVDQGKTVSGFSYWNDPFERKMPVLDVKLLNNEPTTLVVQEIEIDVRRSELVDRDLVFVRACTYNGVEFCNEGWGDLTQATLRLEFPGTALAPIDMEPGDIRGRLWVPIDQDALRPGRRTQQRSQGESPDRLSVEGLLSYHVGRERNAERRRLRFSTEIFLGVPQQGAPGQPSATYTAYVQAGRAPQVVRIACSQVVKSGDLERFLVVVRSDRWHRFECVLRLKLIDGSTLESREIVCEVLVPRSEQRRQREEQAGSLAGLYEAEAHALAVEPRLSALRSPSFDVLASTALQLQLLSDLGDKATDARTRRQLLRTIRACVQPSPLVFKALKAIVADEDDVGLVDDAVLALTSGAFDPMQVLSPILARASGNGRERDSFSTYRCGLALFGYIASAPQEDSRFETAIKSLTDGEAAVLLALGDLMADLDVAKSTGYAKAKARIEAALLGPASAAGRR